MDGEVRKGTNRISFTNTATNCIADPNDLLICDELFLFCGVCLCGQRPYSGFIACHWSFFGFFLFTSG